MIIYLKCLMISLTLVSVILSPGRYMFMPSRLNLSANASKKEIDGSFQHVPEVNKKHKTIQPMKCRPSIFIRIKSNSPFTHTWLEREACCFWLWIARCSSIPPLRIWLYSYKTVLQNSSFKIVIRTARRSL